MLYSNIAAIACPKLEDLQYGLYIASGYTFGHEVRYKCKLGYILTGGAVRKCLATGKWGGEAPVCKRKYLPVDLGEGGGGIEYALILHCYNATMVVKTRRM